jgi:hypothetical protein
MTKRKTKKKDEAFKLRLRIGLLETRLSAFVTAYEADCLCRKTDPRNLLANHTWLALAYGDAVRILKPSVQP